MIFKRKRLVRLNLFSINFLLNNNILFFSFQVNAVRNSMLGEMDRRFASHNDDPLLIIATYLDPRFKKRFLPSTITSDALEEMVIAAFKKKWVPPAPIVTDPEPEPEQSPLSPVEIASISSASASTSRLATTAANVADTVAAASSQIPQDQSQSSSIWDIWDEEFATARATLPSTNIQPTISHDDQMKEEVANLKAEMSAYNAQPLEPRITNVYQWWGKINFKYKLLKNLARDFLSAPASSVYSEQLWSEGGNIYTDKRASLLPENGEKLIFLHHNLPITDNLYI